MEDAPTLGVILRSATLSLLSPWMYQVGKFLLERLGVVEEILDVIA